MLKVKLLEAGAKAPVCGRPGEDAGYDVFALEDTLLFFGRVTKVRTGIAVEATTQYVSKVRSGINGSVVRAAYTSGPETLLGLIIEDRSSMAAKGVFTHGGVIDAGYRGEVIVLMTTAEGGIWRIKAGDKIAQLVPIPVLTGEVVVQDELTTASRGEKGFGSSGQ